MQFLKWKSFKLVNFKFIFSKLKQLKDVKINFLLEKKGIPVNIHEQAISYCRQLNYVLKSVVLTAYTKQMISPT
jgi:SOS response regulatory protein OraA/RecX